MLQALGLKNSSADPWSGARASCDLRRLAGGAGRAIELSFFRFCARNFPPGLNFRPRCSGFTASRLREATDRRSKRWTQRCQVLSDQNVDFLRACLVAEGAKRSCWLMICQG